MIYFNFIYVKVGLELGQMCWKDHHHHILRHLEQAASDNNSKSHAILSKIASSKHCCRLALVKIALAHISMTVFEKSNQYNHKNLNIWWSHKIY